MQEEETAKGAKGAKGLLMHEDVLHVEAHVGTGECVE